MPHTSLIQFGTQPDTDFITRPGSYAVFFNHKHEAGIVRTDRGYYFLAGGGIEAGESPEETLHRELREEAGIVKTEIKAFLGKVTEYHHELPSDRHYKKDAHLYWVQPQLIQPEQKVEEDHTLLWLPVEEALPLMYHEAYSWAIEEGYKLWRNAN